MRTVTTALAASPLALGGCRLERKDDPTSPKLARGRWQWLLLMFLSLGGSGITWTASAETSSIGYERYTLSCTVFGPEGRGTYLLVIDDPVYYEWILTVLHRPVVRMQLSGSAIDMVVEQFDADEVRAHLDERLTNWPTAAARMVFDITRSTGDVALTFQGPEHVVPGLKWSENISQALGHCTKGAPVF